MYQQTKKAKDAAEAAQLAEADQRKTAEKERDNAKEANEDSQAVQEFFNDNVLKAARTADLGGLGPNVSLHKAIDEGIKHVSEKLGGRGGRRG